MSASTNNPLAVIINIIPWKPSIVDPFMLDNINTIATAAGTPLTNRNILTLLETLAANKYIEFSEINHTALGRIYQVKRIKNGN